VRVILKLIREVDLPRCYTSNGLVARKMWVVMASGLARECGMNFAPPPIIGSCVLAASGSATQAGQRGPNGGYISPPSSRTPASELLGLRCSSTQSKVMRVVLPGARRDRTMTHLGTCETRRARPGHLSKVNIFTPTVFLLFMPGLAMYV